MVSAQTATNTTTGGTGTADPEAAAKAAAAEAAAKAAATEERRRVRRLNVGWQDAATVRLQFLRDTLRGKALPTGWEGFVLDSIGADYNQHSTLSRHGSAESWAVDIMGIKSGELVPVADAKVNARRLIALIVGGFEAAMAGKDAQLTWRANRPGVAAYLLWLESLGYPLAEAERASVESAKMKPARVYAAVTEGAVSDADNEEDPLAGDDSDPDEQQDGLDGSTTLHEPEDEPDVTSTGFDPIGGPDGLNGSDAADGTEQDWDDDELSDEDREPAARPIEDVNLPE